MRPMYVLLQKLCRTLLVPVCMSACPDCHAYGCQIIRPHPRSPWKIAAASFTLYLPTTHHLRTTTAAGVRAPSGCSVLPEKRGLEPQRKRGSTVSHTFLRKISFLFCTQKLEPVTKQYQSATTAVLVLISVGTVGVRHHVREPSALMGYRGAPVSAAPSPHVNICRCRCHCTISPVCHGIFYVCTYVFDGNDRERKGWG